MVSLSSKVKKALRDFLARIKDDVAPELVILYGSQARGKPKQSSDVDVAVFSSKFNKVTFVEATSYLFSKTSGLGIDLQPVGFPYREFKKSDGEYFIEVIKKQGMIVYSHGKFKI